MERCETPTILGSAAIASLAPAAMAKALVCFPPSLDPMAHEDRLPHGVPGRPTAREAEVGGARTWAYLALLSHEQFVGSSRGARPQPGTALQRRQDPWGAPPKFCAARTPHAP